MSQKTMPMKAPEAKTRKAATFTFCDSGENHIGMEQLGTMAKPGEGFSVEYLQGVKTKLEAIGIKCELINLNSLLSEEEREGTEDAAVLVARDVVSNILKKEDMTLEDLHKEVFVKDIWDDKYYDRRRGRVLNKRARWNNVICDVDREPDYENKKGRLVSWGRMRCLNLIKRFIEGIGGDRTQNFVCEGNYYYDLKKTGIGYHGDAERRKVVAIRIGDSMSLCYNWYHYSTPIGEKLEINLNEGDMYWMSEKAVGTDWKKRKDKTLRHGAGPKDCKYVKLPIKK